MQSSTLVIQLPTLFSLRLGQHLKIGQNSNVLGVQAFIVSNVVLIFLPSFGLHQASMLVRLKFSGNQ